MFDFHQSLRDEYGERDEEKLSKYIDGLMAEFDASPEAQLVREEYGGCGWAACMMEYGFNYIGVYPAEMTTRDFKEVVFELFPGKVSVEPERAGEIVAELRAFWNFVSRQYDATNARAILEALDDNAGSRLHQLLADPANYGMAKSFFMLGSQSGFDMTNPDDVAAFQDAYNAQLARLRHTGAMGKLLEGSKLPAFERPTGDELKKRRKEKRKQRKAKKRNRR